MSQPISPPPRQKPVSAEHVLFAVALIAVAIVSALVVYFVMKSNEPRTFWSHVTSSSAIFSNETTWGSRPFAITRKMGLSWNGAEEVVQNATCFVTVYNSADIPVCTASLRPSDDTVTDIYDTPGDFHIRVQISGMVPSNQHLWDINVYDQLYSS
jgi:hypothetical protein